MAEELMPQAPRAPRVRRRTMLELGLERASIVAALVIWAALWLLDGYFTTQFVTAVGAPFSAGVIVHLVISLTQQYFWRSDSGLRWYQVWVLVGAIGGFNILTSALGLLEFAAAKTEARPGFEFLGAWPVAVPQSEWLAWACVIAAVLIAVRAEREMTRLIWLVYVQWRTS